MYECGGNILAHSFRHCSLEDIEAGQEFGIEEETFWDVSSDGVKAQVSIDDELIRMNRKKRD